MITNNKKWLPQTLLTGIFILSLSGCSSVAEKDEATIFYPPLPNPPRLQYLTSFSTERDLTRETSGFSDFVLGEDINKDSLIRKP